MNLDNCYDLLEAKHNISIKENLIKTIKEAHEIATIKLDSFVLWLNEKKPEDELLLETIINSKNWLLKRVKYSTDISIISKNLSNYENLAEEYTWELLKLDKIAFLNNSNLAILKETFSDIIYHLGVSNFTDYLKNSLPNRLIASQLPSSDIIEHHYISLLKNKNENLNKLLEFEKSEYEKEIKTLKASNELLVNEVSALKDYKYSYDALKTKFFFYQEDLFKKYIFGDTLPNIYGIYNLLKETKTYESNWGNFCFCLTQSNAFEPEPMKLKFNLLNSEMTYKDLGLIFFMLNKFYQYERDLPFSQWIFKVVQIISKQGNTLQSEEEIQIFIKKNFRPYKKTKSLPQFYDKIMTVFASFK